MCNNYCLSLPESLQVMRCQDHMVEIFCLIFMPTTTPPALVYLLSVHCIKLQRVSWLNVSSNSHLSMPEALKGEVPRVVALVSPENLLEMQSLGLHQRATESETVRMEPSNLCHRAFAGYDTVRSVFPKDTYSCHSLLSSSLCLLSKW